MAQVVFCRGDVSRFCAQSRSCLTEVSLKSRRGRARAGLLLLREDAPALRLQPDKHPQTLRHIRAHGDSQARLIPRRQGRQNYAMMFL